MTRDYRNLRAFALADALVLNVYVATRLFPPDERFGLTSQMRRAAVSTAANIVEGCSRPSTKEFVRFLTIALGSMDELGYYIGLAARLQYLSDADAGQLKQEQDRAGAVLSGLIRSLAVRKHTCGGRRETGDS